MTQLSQFNLKLTLIALRSLRKDIENQPGPVEDPHIQRLLKVPLLTGAQGVIKKDQFRSGLLNERHEFFDLAFADEEAGIRMEAFAAKHGHGQGSGG